MTCKVELSDERATQSLGYRLGKALPDNLAGWTILLRGELGAGKSTLARALLEALGHSGIAPSPTYTLVEPYDLSGKSVYHIDLYRITDAEELEFLGWSDLSDGLRLIEWPERVPGLEQQSDLSIRFDYTRTGRSATLTAMSDRGAELLAGMDLK